MEKQVVTITKEGVLINLNIKPRELCDIGMHIVVTQDLDLDEVFDCEYTKDETLEVVFNSDPETGLISFDTQFSRSELLIFVKALLISYYMYLKQTGEEYETQ